LAGGGAVMMATGLVEAGVAGCVWAARTVCVPVTVISVALMAATTHTVTAAAAVAAPGLALILLHAGSRPSR
jgi:hypothetical protein